MLRVKFLWALESGQKPGEKDGSGEEKGVRKPDINMARACHGRQGKLRQGGGKTGEGQKEGDKERKLGAHYRTAWSVLVCTTQTDDVKTEGKEKKG